MPCLRITSYGCTMYNSSCCRCTGPIVFRLPLYPRPAPTPGSGFRRDGWYDQPIATRGQVSPVAQSPSLRSGRVFGPTHRDPCSGVSDLLSARFLPTVVAANAYLGKNFVPCNLNYFYGKNKGYLYQNSLMLSWAPLGQSLQKTRLLRSIWFQRTRVQIGYHAFG
jgi:hypothetical protein